jgi:hypothetical protein
MPPLTLGILTSVLKMQGADASITSYNKGVEELSADIRGPNESASATYRLHQDPVP